MAGENINRRLNIYINDREVTNSARGIDIELAKVRNQMKSLVKGTDDYDVKLKELKDTYSKLKKDQENFRKELGETPSLLSKIKSSLGPVATGILTAFSVSAVVGGFVNKIREAGRLVSDFDQKQADLAAVMGKSRSQITGLTIDAIKYGSTTSKSASEVSELQLELAKLGKTSTEIKAMTKDVINASNALETDLASAAVLVGGQLNSYGENANQAGKYSDIMANSVNLSATSYEYLATGLPKVSAVAALNNVTFERLNATMGTLADQNVAAETAGTGFRNILLEAAKAGKPYQEMLDEVKNSADQSKKAVELFGKENATVAVILANSTDKINENTKALENSTGAAEELAKERLNSIKGSVEGFSGAWEGFILSLEKGDGLIARTIRGFIDLGTSVLNLITPMQTLSEQLEQEQLDLNVLVSRITSTNTSNEERLRLINQLKNNYPQLAKTIDLETVSNEDLLKIINKVNESYVKRIVLQKLVEKAESAQSDQVGFQTQQAEKQLEIFSKLNSIKGSKKLDVTIDFGNLEKSFEDVKKKLKQTKQSSFLVSDLESDFKMLQRLNVGVSKTTDVFNIYQKQVEETAKTLGINTEAQNEENKALEDQAEILKKLREEAKKLGFKEADTSTEKDLKLWLAAYKEKLKYTGELSEEEKRKREKELNDAKKHSDDLKKQLEASEKELLETKRQFQDISLGNLKDSYEKEREAINIEYDRKIEDLKNKITQEQNEIDKLNQEKKNPKNSKSDVALLQKQIENKIELQKVYNNSSIALEETRTIKLASLQEKYLNQDIKRAEENNKKQLEKLKQRQEIELAGVNSLAEAKAVLENYLSDEELAKVKTLQDAKQRIKEEHLKEEYRIQEEYLLDMIARIQSIFAQEQLTGIDLVSPEEREALLEFLDEAAIKLNNLNNGKKNLGDDGKDAEISTLSGIDVLGFSPEQWQNAFDSLDTWAEKLEAVSVVIGGLKSAFGTFFTFLEAGDRRSLAKFEASQRKKEKALSDQLEKGYITQEIYNARKEKLDIDAAKKKANLEYKQAVREKIMNVAGIISNTAMGVSKALAQGGFIFGVPWSTVIASIGALQLTAALAQPLPPKDGYKKGGFTGNGDPNDVSTVLGNKDYTYHKREYVIPSDVLFSKDPAVPSIVGYLEAKRTGKVSNNTSTEAASQTSSSSSSSFGGTDPRLIVLMDRMTDILEVIEEEGIPAYLVNDLKVAKELRKKQRELELIENQAKG